MEGGDKMGKHAEKMKGIGCLIAVLVIVCLIFIPIIWGTIQEQIQINKEEQLRQEGKVISSDTIISQIVEIMKNREEEQLKEYLADDFIYCGSDRNESEYVYGFWDDLKYLVEENYDIEQRGNDLKDQKTYFIYWNTNYLVTDRTDPSYCLQELKIYLKEVVEENQITYKIYKIILTDN